MKHRNYVFWFIFSLLMTLLLFLKLYDNNNISLLTIICDFFAMIGSGIFCSMLVSRFIENQNKAREKRDKEKQRKFLLASVKSDFLLLLHRELVEYTYYRSKYLSDGLDKLIVEDIRVTKVCEMLMRLLAEFKDEENREKDSDCHVISTESIERDSAKNMRIVVNNRLYYKICHQELLELSTHYSTYLVGGILEEEQIELLKQLTSDIRDILQYEPEYGVGDGTILELKLFLFQRACQYFEVLDISGDHKIHVCYKAI